LSDNAYCRHHISHSFVSFPFQRAIKATEAVRLSISSSAGTVDAMAFGRARCNSTNSDAFCVLNRTVLDPVMAVICRSELNPNCNLQMTES
jgi:hypothetical protein